MPWCSDSRSETPPRPLQRPSLQPWMFMDKLAQELLTLLRDMHAGQRRLLQLATARQEAMRLFEIDKLNALMEQEKGEMEAAARLDLQRKNIVARLRPLLGG